MDMDMDMCMHVHAHIHVGMHYVLAADGSGTLTPVAETEFARDRAFGFGASRLAEYIEEKSVGRGLGLATKAAEVHAITIETIRTGGPEAVAAQMLALPAAGRRACSMCTACAWRVCMVCVRHVHGMWYVYGRRAFDALAPHAMQGRRGGVRRAAATGHGGGGPRRDAGGAARRPKARPALPLSRCARRGARGHPATATTHGGRAAVGRAGGEGGGGAGAGGASGAGGGGILRGQVERAA